MGRFLSGKPKTSLLPEVFEQEHSSDRLPSESDDEVEDSHHNWRTCYAAEQADLVNPEQLTRKEQKAMDREIPWREIVAQGGEYLKAFVEAAQKECNSWLEWGAVRPLNKEEALRVLPGTQP